MSLMWKLPRNMSPEPYWVSSASDKNFICSLAGLIGTFQQLQIVLSQAWMKKTGKCNQSLGKPHTPYLGRLCSPNKKQYEQNLSQWPQHHFPGTWEKAHMGLSNQDISRVASFSDPEPFLCSHTLWFIFSPEALYSSVEKHWHEATVLSILTDSAVSWVDGDYWHGQRVNQEHLPRVFAWCWHIGKIASNYW